MIALIVVRVVKAIILHNILAATPDLARVTYLIVAALHVIGIIIIHSGEDLEELPDQTRTGCSRFGEISGQSNRT